MEETSYDKGMYRWQPRLVIDSTASSTTMAIIEFVPGEGETPIRSDPLSGGGVKLKTRVQWMK